MVPTTTTRTEAIEPAFSIPSQLSTDPAVPAGSALLTGEVGELLAVLAADRGWEITAVRPHQVVCKLDHSLTVAYDLTLAGGEARSALVVAQAGGRLPESGATIVSDGNNRIALWVYPDDPALPGLAVLLDGESLAGLLGQLGVAEPVVSLEVRSYRPGRRAVVEVVTRSYRLFAKVVRPAKVSELQTLHQQLAGVPAPRSLGWSAEVGIVVLEALAGSPLDAVAPLDAEGIVRLLDCLPALNRPVISPVSRAGEHARLLRLLSPDHAGLLATAVARIASVADAQQVPVHGDLHAGQVLVAPDGGLALVDVDSAGMGQRADDLAGLLAHLGALGKDATELWTRWDSGPMRLRAAAALLGFASGPFVAQQVNWPAEVVRRIELAAAWAGA